MTLPQDYPPFVYVPCAEPVTDPAQARVQYRTTRDGRRALLVYSALDRLHRGIGDAQPWFVTATPGLQVLHDREPFDLVLLDVLVPEDQRVVR